MNPNASHSCSPIAMFKSIFKNRNLIFQLAKREIVSRYKGSLFGLAWSLFNPLLMLTIYTFVFSIVLKVRWGNDVEPGNTGFALILFIGLVMHGFLAETITRAPVQILSNVNYVKKVIFPLEIISIVGILSSAFQLIVSFLIIFISLFVLSGVPSLTIFLAPITIFPLIPITLGFSWILNSLGVYIRDVNQFIGILVTVLLFLAPILYPSHALPEILQKFLYLNPLTVPIEQTRGVILFGQLPDWYLLAFYSIASMSVCFLGFWWFQKTRKGYSDVL